MMMQEVVDRVGSLGLLIATAFNWPSALGIVFLGLWLVHTAAGLCRAMIRDALRRHSKLA